MRIIGLSTLPRAVLTNSCRWLAVLMLCLAWVSSEAADFVWSGPIGGDWTDVANWQVDTAGVLAAAMVTPGATDTVEVPVSGNVVTSIQIATGHSVSVGTLNLQEPLYLFGGGALAITQGLFGDSLTVPDSTTQLVIAPGAVSEITTLTANTVGSVINQGWIDLYGTFTNVTNQGIVRTPGNVTFDGGESSGTIFGDPTATVQFIGGFNLSGGAISSITVQLAGVEVSGSCSMENSPVYLLPASGAPDSLMLDTGVTLTIGNGVVFYEEGAHLVGNGALAASVLPDPAGAFPRLVASLTVSPGGDGVIGALTIQGSLYLDLVGLVHIDLNAAAHDSLTVTGTANLDGYLHLQNLAAHYTAGITDPILTVPSHTGEFWMLTGDRSEVTGPDTITLARAWNPANTMSVTTVLNAVAPSLMASQTIAANSEQYAQYFVVQGQDNNGITGRVLSFTSVTAPTKADLSVSGTYTGEVALTAHAGATGSDTTTLTVSDDFTTSAAGTVSITYGTPGTPVIASAGSATAHLGQAFTFQLLANEGAWYYTASLLPPGLVIAPLTGVISGTPTAVGLTTVTLTAANSTKVGGGTLLITVVPDAPVISSSAVGQGAVSTAFTYQIVASGSPTAYTCSTLPAGLTFAAGTGLISGTPTVAGNSQVVIGAVNAGGTSTTALTLQVTSVPLPVITMPLVVYVPATTPASAFSYALNITSASNVAILDLPSELHQDPAHPATFGGTPTITVQKIAKVVASNAGGSVIQWLGVSIAPPPTVTAADSVDIVVGTAFSYQITATGSPTAYAAAGLPTGLSVDAVTGLITGTPATLGTTVSNVGVASPYGTAIGTLTVNVIPPVPAISSATSGRWEVGVLNTYQISASGTPTSYNAFGLPPGVSIDTATGIISGTITTIGTWNISLTAANVTGTGSGSLQLTSFVQVPVITSATTVSATINTSFTYQIVAGSAPTAYTATGLPTGLTIDTATGVISGTPTIIGTSFVSISATNSQGTGRGLLTLKVLGVPPVITSVTSATGVVDAAFTYQIVASNTPTVYGASGLPAGLTINSATGAISGAPTAAGTSSISIIATNPFGSNTATLTLVVTLPVPVITSPVTVTGAVDLAFNYQILARYSPTAYSASALPAGLVFNSTTGAISGTPTAQGTTSVTVTATNVTGTGSTTVSVIIGAAGSGGTTSGTTSGGTTTGAPPGTITDADDSGVKKCGLGSAMACMLGMLALGAARLGRRKDR